MPTFNLPHTKAIVRIAGVDAAGWKQKRMVLAKNIGTEYAVELEPGKVYQVSELAFPEKAEYLLATEDGTKPVGAEELPGLFAGKVVP